MHLEWIKNWLCAPLTGTLMLWGTMIRVLYLFVAWVLSLLGVSDVSLLLNFKLAVDLLSSNLICFKIYLPLQ